jgi:hypothetical protein
MDTATRTAMPAPWGPFSAERLGNGWRLLANCPVGESFIGIVLIRPRTGVALLEIDPHWTPGAEALFRRRLDEAGFTRRFAGNLPVIHRRLRPQDVPALEIILAEAFVWLDPISIEPDAPWEDAIEKILTPAVTPVIAATDHVPMTAALHGDGLDPRDLPPPPSWASRPSTWIGVASVCIIVGGAYWAMTQAVRSPAPVPPPARLAPPVAAPAPPPPVVAPAIVPPPVAPVGRLPLQPALDGGPFWTRAPTGTAPSEAETAAPEPEAAPAAPAAPAEDGTGPGAAPGRSDLSPASGGEPEPVASLAAAATPFWTRAPPAAPPASPVADVAPADDTPPKASPDPETAPTLPQALAAPDRIEPLPEPGAVQGTPFWDVPALTAAPAPDRVEPLPEPDAVEGAPFWTTPVPVTAVAAERIEPLPEPGEVRGTPFWTDPVAVIRAAAAPVEPVAEPPELQGMPFWAQAAPPPAAERSDPIPEPAEPLGAPFWAQPVPTPLAAPAPAASETPAPAAVEAPAPETLATPAPAPTGTPAPTPLAPPAPAPAAIPAPAPPAPPIAAPPATQAPAPAAATDPARAAFAFRRGSELLAVGDISGARRFLESAARDGNGAAAFALAETFDPRAPLRRGVIGAPPDRAAALQWYRRAETLGIAEAASRIATLEAQR